MSEPSDSSEPAEPAERGDDDPEATRRSLHQRIIGLGERSFRKTYYPELQARLAELERFRAAIDASPDAIFVLEVPSARVLDMNRAAAAYLGSPEPEEGHHFGDIAEVQVLEALTRLFESPAGADALVLQTSLAGGTPVEITFRRHPELHCAVAVARDIRDRLALESALRAAKEKAEAADHAKSVFLDIASHELRTPLTPLKLAVQQALRLVASEGTFPSELLRRVARQVTRLTWLVDDLLDASRLERGELKIAPVRGDLRDVLREVLEDYQTSAPRRLSVDLGSKPAPALVDALRIGQVLANLLDNALKYTPEAAPIQVTLHVGDVLELSVLDAGGGIPESEHAAIFERFHRFPAGVTSRQRGTGLGLWIAREIVTLHGGRLFLRKSSSAGSEFVFTLPKAR